MILKKYEKEGFILWFITLIFGVMGNLYLALVGVENYESPIFSGYGRVWDIFLNDPYEHVTFGIIIFSFGVAYLWRENIRQFFKVEEGWFGKLILPVMSILFLWVLIKLGFFITYLVLAFFFDTPPHSFGF